MEQQRCTEQSALKLRTIEGAAAAACREACH